jgi:hypothetical protein
MRGWPAGACARRGTPHAASLESAHARSPRAAYTPPGPGDRHPASLPWPAVQAGLLRVPSREVLGGDLVEELLEPLHHVL